MVIKLCAVTIPHSLDGLSIPTDSGIEIEHRACTCVLMYMHDACLATNALQITTDMSLKICTLEYSGIDCTRL